MAVLHYSSFVEERLKPLMRNQLRFWKLMNFELVHLKSIKENFAQDDLDCEMQAAIQALRKASQP